MALWRKDFDSSHLAEPRMLVGAEVVYPPGDRLGGPGFTVRHPDGTVIEYIHRRPSDSDS